MSVHLTRAEGSLQLRAMETDLTRRKPLRRWLKRAIDLPGTLSHLRVWAAWLSKAWAWLLVVMPGPVILLRGWLVDRILDVVVIGLSFVVSAAGVLLLRSQAKRPNPEVERLKALTPRIREARDTFHEMGPSGGQRFISLTIELAAHLEALRVHCPASWERATVSRNGFVSWIGCYRWPNSDDLKKLAICASQSAPRLICGVPSGFREGLWRTGVATRWRD